MELKEYSSPTLEAQLSISSDQQSDHQIIPGDEHLPPIDGGIHAWLFLAASTMLEALAWGMLAERTQ